MSYRETVRLANVADAIAREFHATYEELAPKFGYETREASRRPWADVPEDNRRLMQAVVLDLLRRNIIREAATLKVESSPGPPA